MSIYKQAFDDFLVAVNQSHGCIDNTIVLLTASEIGQAVCDDNDDNAYVLADDGKRYNPFAYFLMHAEDLSKLVQPLKDVLQKLKWHDGEHGTKFVEKFLCAAIMDTDKAKKYSVTHKVDDPVSSESLGAMKKALYFEQKLLVSSRDVTTVTPISPSPSDAFADIAEKFRQYIAVRRTHNSAFMQSWNTANIIRSLKVELEQAIIDAEAMVPGNAKIIAARILNPTTEDDRCLLRLVKHPTNWTVSWVFNTTSLALLRGIVNDTQGVDQLKADIEEKQRRLGDFVATPPVSSSRLGLD